MTIGLITITHNAIGANIVDAAESILGPPPMHVTHFTFTGTDCAENVKGELARAVADLDRGDGVLILADLYGSTPCNIARRLAPAHQVRVVSGISLPMVLRVFSYARLDLAQIALRATDGARLGIVECDAAN
jgi:PTS system ascorbate-specific IIA component